MAFHWNKPSFKYKELTVIIAATLNAFSETKKSVNRLQTGNP